jgi:hypothetical protein
MISAANAREITDNTDKYIDIKKKIEGLSPIIEKRAEQGYDYIVIFVSPESENLYTHVLERFGYKVERKPNIRYLGYYYICKISW